MLQDALSDVIKVYPPLKLKVFCGRYHSLHKRPWKVLRVMRRVAEERGSVAVEYGRRKGREEQADCVMQLSERNHRNGAREKE